MSGGARQQRHRTSGTAPASPRGNGRPRRAEPAQRAVDEARRIAFEVLRAVTEEDAYANLVLPGRLRSAGVGGQDAAFATDLTYGTLRWRGTYDAVLGACLERPLDDVEPAVLDALRLGVHQVLGMRVPAHAAVDTTVGLVAGEVGRRATGFANAVLRRVAGRDRDGWLDVLTAGMPATSVPALALRTSHPEWIVRALRDGLSAHGRPAEELPDLLAADNVPAAVTLAALPGLGGEPGAGPGAGDGGRAGEGGEGDRAPGGGLPAPTAFTVRGDPGRLPGVRAGRVRVQDAGSQLVALALAEAPLGGPDRGRWLDLCAGPGGKTALLGATMAARAAAAELPADWHLRAVEQAPHRARLVRDAVRALPNHVDVVVGDARGDDAAGRDRVLLDAPCSGLGALRRRPEARWRRSAADLATLTPLQRGLLEHALGSARPGGVVAYVTCSPHPAETIAVVGDVTRNRRDVTVLDAVPVVAAASDGRARDLGTGPFVQLWPHRHGTDAMFLALLRVDGAR